MALNEQTKKQTLKSLLTELPNIIQMAKQTGLIKNENQELVGNVLKWH